MLFPFDPYPPPTHQALMPRLVYRSVWLGEFFDWAIAPLIVERRQLHVGVGEYCGFGSFCPEDALIQGSKIYLVSPEDLPCHWGLPHIDFVISMVWFSHQNISLSSRKPSIASCEAPIREFASLTCLISSGVKLNSCTVRTGFLYSGIFGY